MKRLIIGLLLLGIAGCRQPNLDDPETLDEIITKAIDYDDLQWRGKEGEKLPYVQNVQTPYTGWIKIMHESGQVECLGHYKDGKDDGLCTTWYEDGQKMAEAYFKDGEQDGPSTTWYEDGQKMAEAYFKDGKVITVVAWKPNGEKCPVTKVVDGNGIAVHYSDDGEEKSRTIYKGGVAQK